jgi:hypothetical protein
MSLIYRTEDTKAGTGRTIRPAGTDFVKFKGKTVLDIEIFDMVW